jgi:hypothetical protein
MWRTYSNPDPHGVRRSTYGCIESPNNIISTLNNITKNYRSAFKVNLNKSQTYVAEKERIAISWQILQYKISSRRGRDSEKLHVADEIQHPAHDNQLTRCGGCP